MGRTFLLAMAIAVFHAGARGAGDEASPALESSTPLLRLSEPVPAEVTDPFLRDYSFSPISPEAEPKPAVGAASEGRGFRIFLGAMILLILSLLGWLIWHLYHDNVFGRQTVFPVRPGPTRLGGIYSGGRGAAIAWEAEETVTSRQSAP